MCASACLIGIFLSSCMALNLSESENLSATINRSEWATANRLSLDLETGRYSISPGVYTEGHAIGAERIRRQSGTLDAETLDELVERVEAVAAAGAYNPQCIATPRRERRNIVVTNGGPLQLDIKRSGERLRIRDELECWNDESEALYDRLEEIFDWSSGLSAFDPKLRNK